MKAEDDGMKMDMSGMKDMSDMKGMDMSGMKDMNMDMSMGDMSMKHPHWQSVALSALHCGAGCTLAIGSFVGASLWCRMYIGRYHRRVVYKLCSCNCGRKSALW